MDEVQGKLDEDHEVEEEVKDEVEDEVQGKVDEIEG